MRKEARNAGPELPRASLGRLVVRPGGPKTKCSNHKLPARYDCYLAQPKAQALASSGFEVEPDRFVFPSQFVHVDAGDSEFERVTDEPTLEPDRSHFWMKLECDRIITIRKGLIFTDLGRGQPHRSGGKIERVPVPVKHASIQDARQTRSVSIPRQIYREEADFLTSRRVDAGAKSPSHQLGSQANADYRASAFQPPFDVGDLPFQERILSIVASADRSSEDHGYLVVSRIQAAEIINAGLDIADVQSTFEEYGFECAEILESYMPNSNNGAGHL